jgi:hypothetical protein
MNVKSIDKNQVKKELKKCPQIIQDYVRSLEGLYENQKEITNKAIRKINELNYKQ